MYRLMCLGLLLVLAACAKPPLTYSGPADPVFDALLTEPWAANEFAKYQRTLGHKAFAYASSNGRGIATGYADDKVSPAAAMADALRMCRHFAGGEGECLVVDVSSADVGNKGLHPDVVAAAPKALIAHRDIRSYVNYLRSGAPKAIVIAEGSGRAFVVTESADKAEAQTRALAACRAFKHPSDPSCRLLDSQ